MSIYISSKGKQSGPLEEAEVISALNTGSLSPNDLGIRHGGTEWKPLEELFPGVVSDTVQQPVSVTSGCRRVLGVMLLVVGLLATVAGGIGGALAHISMDRSTILMCIDEDRWLHEGEAILEQLRKRGLSNVRYDDEYALSRLSEEDRALVKKFNSTMRSVDMAGRACSERLEYYKTWRMMFILLTIVGLSTALVGFFLRRNR